MLEIKLVLLKDVPNLGRAGKCVQVKSGFGRNYLLPKNLAALPDSPEARKTLCEIKNKKVEKLQQAKIKEEKKAELEQKQKAAKVRKEKLLAKSKK